MDKGRRRAGVLSQTQAQARARENMEERLKTMEEISNKNILKMQQSHRIQAKVYEKMLSEQELFWKEQLAEKDDQIRQMEAEIGEWKHREKVLVDEMKALELRAMEGTSTLQDNFLAAYQQLCDAMVSFQRMKAFIEDGRKKKKERRQRKEREREERMLRSRHSDDEEQSGDAFAPDGSSLHFKPGVGGGGPNYRTSGSADQDWNRQVAQLDGKWYQIKDIMETMREEMEQKSMLGSAALKQSFAEAYEHLVECMDLMGSVKLELEEQARRRRKENRPGGKDCFWKRWYRRIQTGMGLGMQIGGHVGHVGGVVREQVVDQVAHWTGLGGAGGGQTPPRRATPRPSPAGLPPVGRGGRRTPLARLGRSRSRQQQQRDDI